MNIKDEIMHYKKYIMIIVVLIVLNIILNFDYLIFEYKLCQEYCNGNVREGFYVEDWDDFECPLGIGCKCLYSDGNTSHVCLNRCEVSPERCEK